MHFLHRSSISTRLRSVRWGYRKFGFFPVATLCLATGLACGARGSIHSSSGEGSRVDVQMHVGEHPAHRQSADSEHVASSVREVTAFSAIHASGAISVEIHVGPATTLQLQGHPNRVENTDTTVRSGVLHLEPKGRHSGHGELRAIITTPELNGIELSGASIAKIQNWKTDFAEIEVSGASMLSGNGRIASLEIDASGASSVEIPEIQAMKVNAHASGASTIKLTILDTLEAHASGASSIRYLGTPNHVSRHVSGASQVSPAD